MIACFFCSIFFFWFRYPTERIKEAIGHRVTFIVNHHVNRAETVSLRFMKVHGRERDFTLILLGFGVPCHVG
jgi:hypothetical protein